MRLFVFHLDYIYRLGCSVVILVLEDREDGRCSRRVGDAGACSGPQRHIRSGTPSPFRVQPRASGGRKADFRSVRFVASQTSNVLEKGKFKKSTQLFA